MATADETTKNSPNDWAFVADFIQGSDADCDGNFANDTMLCFSKHGTLALTFHANFNSGIVCAKCFQFMKPGSFALHCDKCNKDPAPSAKTINEWSDSDKKWAGLRRKFPEEFSLKRVVKTATRDGLSAYVVHPRFYLGKTSSTMKLRALCITDGCTHACAFNALHRHFKKAHMKASYSLHGLNVVEAPTSNDVDDSSASDGDNREEEEAVDDAEKEGDKDEEDGMGEKAIAGGSVAEEEEGTEDEKEEEAEEDRPGKGESGDAVDSQDAECEAFLKDDGPSDDDTTEEHGEEGNQEKEGKTKTVEKQNMPAPVRNSARKRRAPTRY
jgi:hypothetical protein